MIVFRRARRPNETLIGVLRTLLGSIEGRKSADPASRSYLYYIKDFLGKMGITSELAPLQRQLADADNVA